MPNGEPEINILMYHSISPGPGPTCIAPAVFRQQMAALADAGYRGVSLPDFASWARGKAALPSRAVVLTFDDGFADFAEVGYQELRARGWSATMLLPAGKVGGTDDWPGSCNGGLARRLMDWPTVVKLSQDGIDFGAHGVTHADLTAMAPQAARDEIVASKRMIEDRTGRAVRTFAPPYGKTNPAVRDEVSRHYDAAVGTTLASARRSSDLYALPRIEMWYFRNPRRWRAYLEGRSRGYFLLRQTLRRVRVLAQTG